MNKSFKRIVIVGATSRIAEHCARLWNIEDNIHFFLIARNAHKAWEISLDLKARNPSSNVEVIELDFLDPQKIITAIDTIFDVAPVDLAFIAHGLLPDQKKCQKDIFNCKFSLDLNAISPVLFAEKIIERMEIVNYGTVALIGSVAGDRVRKSNYVYGAAKSFVASYVQGLQHRFAGNKAIKIILIKPGPTATPMTAGIVGISLAKASDVAEEIVYGIFKGKEQIYTPRKWQFIMMIIKGLPKFIFNKLDI